MALGADLNCFEWQNRSSDYLDGILIGAAKQESDEHVESCAECGDRHKHYRLIVSSINGQARSALPVPIRKSPFSASLPRLDPFSRRSRWERLPWFLRTGLEGAGIISAVLLVIVMVPRVRTIYERSIENRIDTLLRTEPGPMARSDDDAAAVPLGRGNMTGDSIRERQPGHADEFSSGESDSQEAVIDSGSADESESAEPVLGTDIRVGNAEIWRFNLKTDSPKEVRGKVVQILTDSKIPSATLGVGGVEAPGGIQFDILVTKETVPILKTRLEALGKTLMAAAIEAGNVAEPQSPRNQPFTWYKNKSRRSIPSGQARVVIWLSQL